MSQHPARPPAGGMTPIMMLGPASTGSKLVRNLIAEHPDVEKMQYDVNYIWRYGNEHINHDELDAASLTPELTAAIRKRVLRFHTGAPYFIEKTNASSLRVPFVHKIFPDAWWIHLTRDPMDVVQSANRRWQEKPDWGYIVRKARTFPLLESFGYAVNYGINAVKKALGLRASSWGQVYAGMPEDQAKLPLLRVCTRQYIRTVEKARRDVQQLDPSRLMEIRYEDFVTSPKEHLLAVADFLGLDPAPFEAMDYSIVTPRNVGKGARELSAEEQAIVRDEMASEYARLGIEAPAAAGEPPAPAATPARTSSAGA